MPLSVDVNHVNSEVLIIWSTNETVGYYLRGWGIREIRITILGADQIPQPETDGSTLII